MFSQERPSFEGRFYRIQEAVNSPRPIQQAGPPILVGGGGEKRTLRLVARYADMSHWFSTSLEDLRRKTAILEGYCAEIGRDPSQITRTMGAPVLLVENEREAAALREHLPPERLPALVSNIEQAAERLRPYIDAGFRGFTFGNPNLNTPEKLGMAGEVKKLLE
jgi:alkanesulfonate monooxygenase SsuD/methylene tetrahydromethanopterin reductase-like flavin-dependent oxidoreductase (luciferase family)